MEMQRYCFWNRWKNIYLHLLGVPLLLTHPFMDHETFGAIHPHCILSNGGCKCPNKTQGSVRDRYYSIKRSVSVINHSDWWWLIRGQIGHLHQRRNQHRIGGSSSVGEKEYSFSLRYVMVLESSFTPHLNRVKPILPPSVISRFTSWPHLSCGSSCRPKCF